MKKKLSLKIPRFVPFCASLATMEVNSDIRVVFVCWFVVSSFIVCRGQRCQIWHLIWDRLAPNGRNLGLFKIRFSTFWLVYIFL